MNERKEFEMRVNVMWMWAEQRWCPPKGTSHSPRATRQQSLTQHSTTCSHLGGKPATGEKGKTHSTTCLHALISTFWSFYRPLQANPPLRRTLQLPVRSFLPYGSKRCLSFQSHTTPPLLFFLFLSSWHLSLALPAVHVFCFFLVIHLH